MHLPCGVLHLWGLAGYSLTGDAARDFISEFIDACGNKSTAGQLGPIPTFLFDCSDILLCRDVFFVGVCNS